MSSKPILYLIIPCYNEEAILTEASSYFFEKIHSLIGQDIIDNNSRILFVDDGSSDQTWDIIDFLSVKHEHCMGISLSHNSGQQNALLAGLMEAKNHCDITITIDCDGQDDIQAVDEMISAFLAGNDIVYGVRNSRKSDHIFKRTTAQLFYKLLHFLGVETVSNHSDYRLLSNQVLCELSNYKEVNLYLRGMIPLLGFQHTCVYYDRKIRMNGTSHYPLGKMISLALDGITSFSSKPIRMISSFGILVAGFSFLGVLWSIIGTFQGHTVPGWASTTCFICFLSGVQIISLGIIGEYIGKIYLETKHRPRYIIYKRTQKK
ncbi:MAG: glycosyltransferase family 2 protein [Anaerostipes sp.]|nr:glycosyltransferase family 2 protein [Anaerostipes sp.]